MYKIGVQIWLVEGSTINNCKYVEKIATEILEYKIASKEETLLFS